MEQKTTGRTILLIEPESLMRRTVASVARELRLANIREMASVDSANRAVGDDRFDAILIALDDSGAALQLMEKVRSGESKCDKAIPMVVMTPRCDAGLVERLKELSVRRVLVKPFKVKGVLDAIAMSVSAPKIAA